MEENKLFNLQKHQQIQTKNIQHFERDQKEIELRDFLQRLPIKRHFLSKQFPMVFLKT